MKQRNLFFIMMLLGLVLGYQNLSKADNEWVDIELEEERTAPVEGAGEEEEYIVVGGVREQEPQEEGEGVEQIEGEGDIDRYYD